MYTTEDKLRAAGLIALLGGFITALEIVRRTIQELS